jgi:hypothetical protein
VWHTDLSHQVHKEDDPPAQDAYEQQIFLAVIRADFRAKLSDPFLEALFIDQDFSNDVVMILHGIYLGTS